MVPARSVLGRRRYRHCDGRWGSEDEYRDAWCMTRGYMGEEDARTGGDVVAGNGDDVEEGDAGTSDSRRGGEGGGEDEGWLQLGLGSSSSAARRPDGRQPGGLLELNLFSDRPSECPSTCSQPRLRWGAGDATAAAQPLGPRPPMYIPVGAPAWRAQSGVWFLLQASQSQAREALLPQIPKCYLRIKDGGMRIRVLIKYVVNKLGLHSESEVEITCRGRQLPPHLTLQHVRDRIWCPRDVVAAPTDFPVNPVMTLHYGRSTSRLVYN